MKANVLLVEIKYGSQGESLHKKQSEEKVDSFTFTEEIVTGNSFFLRSIPVFFLKSKMRASIFSNS